MGKIHVGYASGQEREYEEEEVLSLWSRGLIRPDALYWKDGMSEWEPLADYLHETYGDAPAPPVAQPGADESGGYVFARDPAWLTAFLVVMLWVSLGSEVVSIASDAAQLSLLKQPFFTPDAVEANDARQGLVGIGYILVFLVTAFTFLKWVYRATLNSQGFGAVGMRCTPGWAVGCYFVPFLNLVRPYQVMKELWQISQDPKTWQLQDGSPLLGWWWGLWLVSGALGQLVFRLSREADTIEELRTLTTLSIVASAVAIPLTLLALTIVRTIAARQRALVEPSPTEEGPGR